MACRRCALLVVFLLRLTSDPRLSLLLALAGPLSPTAQRPALGPAAAACKPVAGASSGAHLTGALLHGLPSCRWEAAVLERQPSRRQRRSIATPARHRP